MSAPSLRRAESGDVAAIEELLREAALPVAGFREHLEHFYVATQNGILIGAVGVELYGDDGLLRSLVVRHSERSKGIGNALYGQVIAEARRGGVRRLILLTTTAEAYFSARGFRKIERATIRGDVTRSAEFSGACPDSAICMELLL